jgi:hypothetical protein
MAHPRSVSYARRIACSAPSHRSASTVIVFFVVALAFMVFSG